MIKLAKYLKPFLVGVALAIALLFLQAMSDLNLPNFMSDIVNVGIQKNGIEHASPDAISENGMTLMQLFMSDEERALADSSYERVEVTAAETELLKTYPDASGTVYRLRATDEDTRTGLDSAFGKASYTFSLVAQKAAAEMGSGVAASESETQTVDIEIEQIYQMLPMLQMIPESAIAEARTQAEASELLTGQTGILLCRSFYNELGADITAMQTRYIWRVGLLMLFVALGGGVATVLVGYLSSKIATGVARNLRRDVFAKVESFSHNEFDKFSTASLITRCTNDITQVQMLLTMGIRMLCYAPIMGIGGVIMALRKSSSMSWIIAVAVVVLIGLILVVMSLAIPKFKIIQKLIDRLNLVSREELSGLMVIRAFGTQAHEKKRFDKANKDLTDVNLFVNRVMVFMMPVLNIVMNGVTLLIVWVGAHQIAASAMQIGDMMAFMQYAMQILMSFLFLSMMFIMLPRAAVSADRIAEVLGTEISIVDPPNPKSFVPAKKGVVEFKNVHFRYHGAEEDALSDISFTARPGETLAIIGSTGSGKSTIANLTMRFYDVTEGQILVDGTDIREVTQTALRGRIGYVPQKGVLLSGTIASNIKYGREDTDEAELEKAARVSQALEFIREKPDGFDDAIAQSGSNVSGGQKQRLSIARALAKKPEILIFDDSFSALDFKTDAELRRSLKQELKDVTQIIVAQRVGTIMNAEQILVLESGHVVGHGTHDELLKTCPVYLEIASSQLTKEELA